MQKDIFQNYGPFRIQFFWGIKISKGRDAPRDVPGQTGTLHPVVLKKILVPVSRCPGTKAGAIVLGQIPLSRPASGQKDSKIFKKIDQIYCFRMSFSCFRTSFPVLEHPFLF